MDRGGKNAKGRICVARYHGWIVTAWGEASLQDWLERMQGKSATPSLADNADYKKSIDRVGKDAQALVYFNYHNLVELMTQAMTQALTKINPTPTPYLPKELAGLGGSAIGSHFEHGEIVDRFSVLESRQSQLESGIWRSRVPSRRLSSPGPTPSFM